MSSQILIGPNAIATVDEEDADWLKRCLWWLSETGQVIGLTLVAARLAPLDLGRAIMNALPNETVIQVKPDNKFDYRKCNLQIVSPRRSLLSRLITPRDIAGLRGVSWHPLRRRYRAQVSHRGCRFELGFYKDPVEAGMIFDVAAHRLAGMWAYCNFPHRLPPPEMIRQVAEPLARFARRM